MNIYVFAVNANIEIQKKTLNSLKNITSIFPQIDPDSLWQYYDGNVFAGSVHTNIEACFPRSYIYENAEEIIFYDGNVINSTNGAHKYNAKELLLDWDCIPNEVEGQFSITKINKQDSSVSLITDFMGMGQVYYCRLENIWIVSNHVGVLQKVGNLCDFDDYGASMLLTMGWIAGEHTLNKHIKVVPGGNVWSWALNEKEPRKTIYYKMSSLSSAHKVNDFDNVQATQLSDQLTSLCSALKKTNETIYCPITGGRDSRVMLSLLVRGNINCKTFIDGDVESEESKISRELAAKFNFQHFNNNISAKSLTSRWDELCKKMIDQNDGMVSLWQVNDISCQANEISRLDVLLYGVGGEIGRRFYKHPNFFVGRKDAFSVSQKLSSCLLRDYGGLIQDEAIQRANNFIYKWTETALDNGINSVEVPDYFYAFERVRRWAGSNFKKITPCFDVFSPFCTRPFVEASFSLNPVYRYSEPLHYAMLSLVPDLHQIRFASGGWNSQINWINILQIVFNKYVSKKFLKPKTTPALDRCLFVKKNLPKIRETCFQHNESTLWEFINKKKLERVLADNVEEAEIYQHLVAIYQITTLFYYQNNLLNNR